MAGKIYINDIGTALILNTLADISSATVINYKFKRPDGSTFLRTGSFVTNGADYLLRYITQDGDMDIDGDWQMQSYLEMPTWRGHSQIVDFSVYRHLAL
ncbi:MAG: hypothetical protein A2W22_03015 [Candidatus Levybacteria bacterium RBG_16_35_11]|nr:MAG: hypothetical protein A2W22_03015 [Candidatus Levybacteria bacterium RBG_16_35_11]